MINASGPGWESAKCIGLGDLFYSPEIDARTENSKSIRETQCRSICFTCDLRVPCLMVAMANSEPDGVWGAMTEAERRRFKTVLMASAWPKKQTVDSFRVALRKFYEMENPNAQ